MENFSLVLSGGGALGIAHLGVIKDLEDNGFKPNELIGTSMGGIICACLSIGMNEKEIYLKIKEFSNIFNWIKFSFKGNSIINNSKIDNLLSSIFLDRKMKDTIIPLKLIATNLQSGDKKVFSSKDDVYIKDALLCTMAIPGIFDEHIVNNQTYVDGFLCENLPISESIYPNILAVDVLGKNSFENTIPNNFFKTSNVLDMFEKSIRLMIYNQSKTHIEYSNKNIILLEPNTKLFKTYQFHKHKDIRSLGFELLENN